MLSHLAVRNWVNEEVGIVKYGLWLFDFDYCVTDVGKPLYWLSTNFVCAVTGIQHTHRSYLPVWNQRRLGTSVLQSSASWEASLGMKLPQRFRVPFFLTTCESRFKITSVGRAHGLASFPGAKYYGIVRTLTVKDWTLFLLFIILISDFFLFFSKVLY